MQSLYEKQQMRNDVDEKTKLINDLYKVNVFETKDGRPIEDVSLFALKHVHANELARRKAPNMNKQERHVVCQMLAEHTQGTYFYYTSLPDDELLVKLQNFNRSMISNSAGEIDFVETEDVK